MSETKKNNNIDNLRGLSQIVTNGELMSISKSIRELKKSASEIKANAREIQSQFVKIEDVVIENVSTDVEVSLKPEAESVSEEVKKPQEEKKKILEKEVKETVSEIVATPSEPVKKAKEVSLEKSEKVEVEKTSEVKVAPVVAAPSEPQKPVKKEYSEAEKAAIERAREKALQIQERLRKANAENGGQRRYENKGDTRSRTPRLDRDGNPYPPRTPGSYNAGGGYNSGNGYQRRDGAPGGFDKDKDANSSRMPARKPIAKAGVGAPSNFPKQDPSKQFGNKNKTKSTDQDKKGMNKRTLIRKGFIPVAGDEFDEAMGARKIRPRKTAKAAPVQVAFQPIKIAHAIVTTDIIPIKTLSEKIGVTATEIAKKLFAEGIMKTINDSIDFETAEYVSMMYNITLEFKPQETAEDVLIKDIAEDIEDENLQTRPPVVTVMGHVDHGKTSLLDAIKDSNVTVGEAGGITQHIGAYSVEINGRQITFIDTPGHEAFTSMRKRGAQITDIAILVVAADDGVMPQTIEAINHIKAAGVELIVAINKMDKPTANKDKIMQQLVEHEVLSEEWGGTTIMVPVSAKSRSGINELLESVLLVADVMELKANPTRKAVGVVVEAQLDKGKGPVATILVQTGTLKVGDTVIAGFATGRIRAMIDDRGRSLKEAGPSKAVSVLGLSEVPEAGDKIVAVENDKLSKAVLAERMKKSREDMVGKSQSVSLEDVFKKYSEGQVKGLNLIVKADVQGSVEAVKQALLKLSNEEVNVKIIHGGVGAVNESDVMLASTSSAIIIAFNVRPDAKTKAFAETENVEIKTYRVIYDAIEDIEMALKGMLEPEFKENFIGSIEVRDVFKITGSGTIAGGYVIEGKITRGAKVKLVREGVIVHEGEISSLKRFKEDVKEVATNYECGIGIANYNDIKVGDIIEASEMIEIKRD